MRIAKIFGCFMCVLIITVSFSAEALALPGEIDIYSEPVLRVEFLDGEKPLSGAKFDIFLIADIDESGNYHPREGFEHFNISTVGKTPELWRELASTIEGYVLQEKMLPYDSAATDENGTIVFPAESEGLVCGLYLLVGYAHAQDGYVYRAESAVVQLPALANGSDEWNYDVTVKPKYSFEPEDEEDEYITRKVLKVWEDRGYESLRPKEIAVYLLCDGVVYDTVKLNAENNWRHTWEKLDDDHRWSVTEKVPEGYSVKITKEGVTFVITNSIEKETPPSVPEKPGDQELPQTGQLWWPVPVLFVIGTAFVAVGLIRRRSGHEK